MKKARSEKAFPSFLPIPPKTDTPYKGRHCLILWDSMKAPEDAWGEITRGGEGKDVNPFLYVGANGVRWQDSTLGMYHMGYRFYNPGIGRFTQMDPLGVEIPGIHYFYANENPIVNIDPDGLRVVSPSSPPTRDVTWSAGMRKYRVGMFLQNLSAGFTPNILSDVLPSYPGAPSKIFHTSCENGEPKITEFPDAINRVQKIFGEDSYKVLRCMRAHEGKHAQQCKCMGSAAYNKIEQMGSSAFNSLFSAAAKMETEAFSVEFECLDGGDVQQYLNSYNSATHCK